MKTLGLLVKLTAISSIATRAVLITAAASFPIFSEAQTQADGRQELGQLQRNEHLKPSLVQRIEQQDARIKTLRLAHSVPTALSANEKYAFDKAQCWLDFSRHEALRNNPTRVPQAAFAKATELVDAIESKTAIAASLLDSQLWGKPLANSTDQKEQLLVQPMRKDLWQQLDSLKTASGLSCSARALACGEVMLIQAAHAHDRFDWRYAQPYFGMAEDFAREAKAKAQSCKP